MRDTKTWSARRRFGRSSEGALDESIVPNRRGDRTRAHIRKHLRAHCGVANERVHNGAADIHRPALRQLPRATRFLGARIPHLLDMLRAVGARARMVWQRGAGLRRRQVRACYLFPRHRTELRGQPARPFDCARRRTRDHRMSCGRAPAASHARRIARARGMSRRCTEATRGARGRPGGRRNAQRRGRDRHRARRDRDRRDAFDRRTRNGRRDAARPLHATCAPAPLRTYRGEGVRYRHAGRGQDRGAGGRAAFA
ncbi:hypothetical protein AWB68_06191 [Caballeronia choica]|uniref:Uncharacterized protein n=1 Tax=Caballeronia choica TaxID=326476 RepID=A0A158KKC2_9BURK|nr:hypothetical protein AWB68_06191 [Caballeronia choica]